MAIDLTQWGQSGSTLDKMLYLRYGERRCGAYLMLDDGEPLTAGSQETVAMLLDAELGPTITKVADALMAEYHPLENYSMEESGTDATETTGKSTYGATSTTSETAHTNDKVTETTTYDGETEKRTEDGTDQEVERVSRSQSESVTVSGTDTTKGVVVSTVTHGHTGTTGTDNAQYAFNSNSGVPTDHTTVTHGDTLTDSNVADDAGQTLTTAQTRTTSYTGTPDETQRTHNYQDRTSTVVRSGGHTVERETSGTLTTTEAGAEHVDATEGTNESTHTLTRHGNIGVTTSQQMLQSELDIRLANRIANIIVKLVGERLTLSTY